MVMYTDERCKCGHVKSEHGPPGPREHICDPVQGGCRVCDCEHFRFAEFAWDDEPQQKGRT